MSLHLPQKEARGANNHSLEGRIVCHAVFFRMYLPLALEVYNRLFINSLGFMVVDKVKTHLLRLTQSILTVSSGLMSTNRRSEYFLLCSTLQVFPIFTTLPSGSEQHEVLLFVSI